MVYNTPMELEEERWPTSPYSPAEQTRIMRELQESLKPELWPNQQ